MALNVGDYALIREVLKITPQINLLSCIIDEKCLIFKRHMSFKFTCPLN